MSAKPFSVRLSDSITKLVQGLSDHGEKTPSDFIREAVEDKLSRSSEYNKRAATLAMEPEKAIAGIRKKLDKIDGEEISLAEIAVMMRFWHKAYAIGNGSNYVNPRYTLMLMEVVKDFLRTAHEQNPSFDFHYSNSIIGSLLGANFDGHNYDAAFERLKDLFLERNSTAWPEMLTRITEHSSDKLDGFLPHVIYKVFTESRIEELFPIAVRGAGVEAGYASSVSNMREFLPDAERLQIGDLKFAIYSDSFALFVEGLHHCYALNPHSTLSLCTFAETDQFLRNLALHGGSIKRDKLEVQLFRGDAVIHENNGYRLHMTKDEFLDLLDNIKRVFANQRWESLLKKIRMLNGDF